MNSSIWTADRGTHLKIMILACMAVAVVVTVGIAARGADPDTSAIAARASGPVLKAEKTSRITASNAAMVR